VSELRCPAELERAQAFSQANEEAGGDGDVPPRGAWAAHLASCGRCRAEWEQTAAVIALARQRVVAPPSRAQLEQIRTAILASSPPPPRREVQRKRWTRAVVALASVAALATLAVHTRRPDERTHVAIVHPHDGAHFAQVAQAPEELVRLRDGTLDVDVVALRSGERFRLVAGSDLIEADGASFEVTASADRLVAVHVVHGHVELRRAGAAPLWLPAAAGWRVGGPSAGPAPAPSIATSVSVEAVPVAGDRLSVAAALPAESAVAVVRRALAGHLVREPARKVPLAVTASPPAAGDGAPTVEELPSPTAPTATPALPADRVPAAAPPDPQEAAFVVGWEAMRRGDFERAAAAFAGAVAVSPWGPLAPDGSYWHAVALARLHRTSDAVTAFREFLVNFPDSPRSGRASAMLGWMLVDTRELEEARRRFEAASLDPSVELRRSARQGLESLTAEPD
jgi:hypothetical protein